MSEYYRIKRGDLLPNFEAYLDDVNASGGTVWLLLRDRDKVLDFVMQCEVLDIDLTDPAHPITHIRYVWTEGETDTVSDFDAEVQVVHFDGKAQTVPPSQDLPFFRFRITGDLGDP